MQQQQAVGAAKNGNKQVAQKLTKYKKMENKK